MKKRILSTLLVLCMVLALLPGTAWASVADGQVNLKPTNEVRWIDRVELPDYALRLYKVLEEAADGDGYNDYLIDDEYYDLEEDNISATGEPGEFVRGNVYGSNGDVTRYTGILVTTTDADVDQDTRDYIANCIRTVVSAFKFDHQEIFWIDGVYRVSFNRNGTRYYCLALCADYNTPDGKNDSYYEIRREEFRPDGQWDIRKAMARRDTDIENVLSTIPAGADRFSQIYYLNDWLSEHNKFNSLISSGEANPWYAYECITALEGLDGEKGPVCSGYSAAFKVLCDALGIPCVTVRGLGGSGGAHRWNYAQMEDGRWYAVDVNYNSDLGDANRTQHLLVGGKTIISSKKFSERHIEQNGAYYGGVKNFLNGPVLNNEAYPRSVHLAYTGMPEKLTLGDSVAMMPTLIFDSGADYAYSSTALPAGLTLNAATGEITGTIMDTSNAEAVTVTITNPSDSADRAECTLKFPLVEPWANYFIDVPNWCAKEANWAVGKGITRGTGGNQFTPYRTCTHAEILAMLYRADGEKKAASPSPFTVKYFQDAVDWAYETGLIGDSFVPGVSCTRADTMKYIWQARGSQSAAGSSFADVDPDADYAAAVSWAVENRITKGTGGGMFSPDVTCSRGEIVTFLYRAYS